jgi:Dyp-type peroxidase family
MFCDIARCREKNMRTDTQLQGITDLTLLTPIKSGFVESFEPITYVARLRAVLKTLNSLRLAARESSNPPSPFTDVVSRFRIVHSFRWAVIDPAPGSQEPARLLLNVCFDGGWEPYMRVIWRDLGTLLDLILCHSVDYRLSRDVPFERYARWVRANEVPADFLFIESGRSVSDQDYLARAESLQRVEAADELKVTRMRTPPPGDSAALPPAGTPAAQAMAIKGLAAIGALYALDRYFSVYSTQGDGWCLLRAAQDILFELMKLDTRKVLPEGHPVRAAYYPLLNWFEGRPPVPVVTPRQLDPDVAQVQGGMLTCYPDLTGGALLLLQVRNAPLALGWLAGLPITSEDDTLQDRVAPDALYWNVALSLSGLARLGANAALLDTLPQPFKEGMEQRAGVLGDLRHNHPKHWPLPRRADGQAIDMGSVHIVLQLRHRADGVGALAKAIAALDDPASGVKLLCVQPMRRNVAGNQTVEAFGFADGISQPVAAPNPKAAGKDWSDEVPRGELLLGYPTSRDLAAVPETKNDLLDNGTFLVIRKLRQRVDRLEEQIGGQAVKLGLDKKMLLAKMMGRWQGGEPLAKPGEVGNDFNYQDDAQASRCPFHAHIRRANPRDVGAGGPTPMPRLLRRGMSYGKPGDEDRGLVFMAYNANLAEQFEVVQRWMAGANSSGGYAGQADPFLGVAVAGQPRVYRFEHQGQVVHLDLGDQPFVELQWGGYYFVPSIPALRNLSTLLPVAPPAPAAPQPLPQIQFPPAPDDFRGWEVWLESKDTVDAAWAHVRAQPGGVLRTAFGVLVGSHTAVDEVLLNANEAYSVRGYASRMRSSIGVGYLGLDRSDGHDVQAPAINAEIEKVSEPEAFTVAYQVARAVLGQLRLGAQSLQLPEATLDFEQLGDLVLAQLCSHWFGLPDGTHMWGAEFHPQDDPSRRCPLAFFPVSRHVFGAQPSPLVSGMGMAAGQMLKQQTRAWLDTGPDLSKWPITKKIVEVTTPLVSPADPDIVERTLAGIILGFPPTVFGNLVTGLALLAGSQQLWDLQLAWAPGAAADADRYAKAQQVLRPALVHTILAKPVPNMVWRVAAQRTVLQGVTINPGETVVVGLSSATHDGDDHFTAFGGRRPPAAQAPMHACPGYAMAMGVLQGVLAAVLEAGTLRPSPSPTVLTLPL